MSFHGAGKFKPKSTRERLQQDLDYLGVDAKVVVSKGMDMRPVAHAIHFKSDEDKNFYRLAGKWKETKWMRMVVLEND